MTPRRGSPETIGAATPKSGSNAWKPSGLQTGHITRNVDLQRHCERKQEKHTSLTRIHTWLPWTRRGRGWTRRGHSHPGWSRRDTSELVEVGQEVTRTNTRFRDSLTGSLAPGLRGRKAASGVSAQDLHPDTPSTQGTDPTRDRKKKQKIHYADLRTHRFRPETKDTHGKTFKRTLSTKGRNV